MGLFFSYRPGNMPKFLKPGKIVIVLQGRYAGRKAVIVKNFDEGTEERKYPHAVLAGIDRYPLKVTKSMSKKKVAQRSRIKPFIKAMNYNHIMPTRYALKDVSLRSTVGPDALEKGKRKEVRKQVKSLFEEKYKNTVVGGLRFYHVPANRCCTVSTEARAISGED